MPQKYAFLDQHHILQKPAGSREFDLVIAADCASFERLGVAGPAIANRKCLINIDHHPSNTRYGDLNWISAREASTGELIFRLLQAAQWPITPAIADCLFTCLLYTSKSASAAPARIRLSRKSNWISRTSRRR